MGPVTDWSAYLDAYHQERPGITEDLLALAQDDGLTPYAWAAQAVPPGGVVLDVCCGSAPLRPLLVPGRYVGVDLSPAELSLAAARGLDVVRGDAAELPIATGAVDSLVVSMALQLVPFDRTLAEAARVLRPGGVLVALVPVSRPLSRADRWRYARLSLALRTAVGYPNDALLRSFTGTPELLVGSDESRAFLVEVSSPDVGDLLLDALYLPGVSDDRLAASRQVVRGWTGHRVAVPIRRVVLVRA